jgi:hypothetical protein
MIPISSLPALGSRQTFLKKTSLAVNYSYSVHETGDVQFDHKPTTSAIRSIRREKAASLGDSHSDGKPTTRTGESIRQARAANPVDSQ